MGEHSFVKFPKIILRIIILIILLIISTVGAGGHILLHTFDLYSNFYVTITYHFLVLFPCLHPQIIQDWKFISMVLDRFFLWVFTLSCLGGTAGIILQSPSLYDTRIPIPSCCHHIYGPQGPQKTAE